MICSELKSKIDELLKKDNLTEKEKILLEEFKNQYRTNCSNDTSEDDYKNNDNTSFDLDYDVGQSINSDDSIPLGNNEKEDNWWLLGWIKDLFGIWNSSERDYNSGDKDNVDNISFSWDNNQEWTNKDSFFLGWDFSSDFDSDGDSWSSSD